MPSNEEKPILISLENLDRFKTDLENTYGKAEGVAMLDADGKVPSDEIPSSAFNVVECDNRESFPTTGEALKIYVDISTNQFYRWDTATSSYVNTSSPEAVKYTPQSLTAEEKTQARENIGAISSEDISDTLKYSEQTLTDEEKAQARSNIGAISIDDVPEGDNVRYVPQELTEEQQAQARQNINALAADELPENVLTYSAQSLTTEQKAQARTNIDAASNTEFQGVANTVSVLNNKINNFGNFVREVNETEGGIEVVYDNNQISEIPTGLVFDGGYVDEETRYLYLKKGDDVLPEEVFTPILIPGGGGGGGGSYIELTDVVKTNAVRNGADAIFAFNASTSDASDVTVKWFVNEVLYFTEFKESGERFTFNAKNYLTPSDESVVKVIIDSEGGGSITRRWTVKSVAFAISWGNSINPIMLYTSYDNIYLPINVSAEANSSNVVTVTIGSHTITKNVNGSLTLTVEVDKTFFETGVNLVTAGMHSAENPEDKAEDIFFTVIWAYQATDPIVAFAKNEIVCNQYDIVNIEYFVFDPNNEIATHSIQIGSATPKILTADRRMQTYQYSPMQEETVIITLTCQEEVTTTTLIAHKSDYKLDYYVDDSLRYNLDPVGHSNSDADRDQFAGLTFSDNFDWENGGFKQDANGVTAFVVKKGNYVILPRSLFADDDSNGKTIDISFKITNSDQYDAVAMQDLNDGNTKGIIFHANNGEIRLDNVVGQMFRYCEDSRIDLSILVETNGDQRIVTVWLDGIPSKVNEYTTSMLTQNENPMYVGSENCDVWLYAIRVYNSELTKKQMIQNYVSEGNTTEEKVRRYQSNTILDENDRITPSALHAASPDLTLVQIYAPRMTVSKKDNVPAMVTITDGATVLELAAASAGDAGDGTVFKVQGTSSAAYGRSSYNLDIDFKGTGKKYKLDENAIGVNYINIKVNVASSENANNINAVDWYNTFQPYITESRTRPGVRDTVQGKPCAVFFTNTSDTAQWFSSQLVGPGETILYAMGDICNSKKNKAVFGQDGAGEHPTKACIEVSGNDTEPERFRSTDAVFNPAADDGKGAWQTTVIEDDKQKTITHFEWRMNPSSADLDEVVTSWNNLVAWVVSTIGDSAKFKREAGNYFAVNSMLYHFLFIEYFAAYDNVSKNTFYSYDWDETAQKYLWNIKAAYDMDTILACDNDGKPYGDYGLDYGDTDNGRSYFNAVDNPIWVNIKEAFQSELSNLYISLRTAGAWDSANIASKWDTYQDKRPHVSMVIDAYTKYVLPYKTNGVIIDGQTLSYDDSYLPRMQGSKIYWRKQFLTYQTAYMDGKYGYYSKTNSLQFRTNCESGKRAFAVKVYAKTYITLLVDDNKVSSQKVDAGSETVFNNVSVGSNTTLYFTPDKLIQYIRPLNDTDNSTFTASGAAKLMEAILGSETPNTSWPAGTGVNIPSVLLKDLSILNLPNFSNALNLAVNVELETLDTRGTNAGLITLPSFAPLKTVQLNACTGIAAYNLNKVETFTMTNGNNLASIRIENCNTLINNAIATYLTHAVNSTQTATRRIRAVGINWNFDNLNVIYQVATKWKGYNALGEEQNTPFVGGTIHVASLSTKKLEIIHSVWGVGPFEDSFDEEHKIWTSPNLTITYDASIPYFPVTFLNMDGSAIKDKKGQNYVQYIDLGDSAYDPITAGEVDTPTYIDPDGQYRYTFIGWINLTGIVNAAKDVTANYSQEIITYTVRWYDKIGGSMYDMRENVPYGGEAVYDPDGTIGFPVLEDQEIAGIYKVFTGWDKSTGYVRGNMDVYATWDVSSLPQVGTSLKDMSVAQIYGIAKTYRASTFFEDEDYTDIQVGRDYQFSDVNSEVLLQERYFNGSEVLRMNDIKLFDEDAPSFTLAIDYEFCESASNATIVSCCNAPSDSEGFRVYYSSENESVNVIWGDRTDVIAHGLNRGIVVLRHRKGSKNLLVTSDNGGKLIDHSAQYGGDEVPEGTYNNYLYDGYNSITHYIELPRAQETKTTAILSFGAAATGTQGYMWAAKGWIHWCKIWYDDLGANIVRELAVWPRETWRMHYRGNGLYVKDDGTGLMDGASFIANAPLAQHYEMYPSTQNTTAGGWKNSVLRSFVNTRCFDALPYAWQAIIKPVNIITKGGSDNFSNLEYTSDKLYVPAFADLQTTTSTLLMAEGSRISWFTENKYRAKFMGINIPETAQIITDVDNDPTLYTDTYVIKEGDVWVPSNHQDRAYVYVTDDTAAKHGWYGGRAINNTTNNIIATGPQGGLWIRSKTYWTRTNATTQATGSSINNHYAVYPSGNVTSAWIYYQSYQRRGILLMFSI